MSEKLDKEQFLELLRELYWLYYPHDIESMFSEIFGGKAVGGKQQYKPREEIVKRLSSILRPVYGAEAVDIAEKFYDYVVSEISDDYEKAWEKIYKLAKEHKLGFELGEKEPGIKFSKDVVEFDDLHKLHLTKIKRFYPSGEQQFYDAVAYAITISDILGLEFGGSPEKFKDELKQAEYELGPDVYDEVVQTSSRYYIKLTDIYDYLPTTNDKKFYEALANELYEAGFYPDELPETYNLDKFVEGLIEKFGEPLVNYFMEYVVYTAVFPKIYEKVKQTRS